MTLRERIESRTDMASYNECWNWQGACTKAGYPRISGKGFCGQPTQKVYFELLYGPLPEGYELDHTCRQRRCINPRHLQACTHQENARRRHIPAEEHAALSNDVIRIDG